MKKQTIILVASAVLVGTASAMGIAKAIKNKKEGNDGAEPTPVPNKTKTGGSLPCGGRAKDTSAYGIKVMALQKKVGITGCDADGLVGDITNGAVKNAYPVLFSKLGNVSPNNIDFYLAGVAPEKTSLDTIVNAVQLYGKKAKVKGGLFYPYHRVYQNIKTPDGQWAESTLPTLIKGGIEVNPIAHFNNSLILELNPSDIYGNNTFYSYVRILPDNVSIG